jgi:hypothetical protein
MVGPIGNPNIQDPGGINESIAASSQMIFSGLEKELQDKNITVAFKEPKISFEELNNVLQEIKSSTSIDPVQKYTQEKRGDDRDTGERSAPQRKKSAKKRKAATTGGKAVVSAGLIDKFGNPIVMDPKKLRDYVIVLAKRLLGLPKEELPQTTQNYLELRKAFLSEGISQELLAKKEEEIIELIKTELMESIKTQLLEVIENPAQAATMVLGNTESKVITQLLGGITEVKADTYNLPELLGAANLVGINLDYWISYWNYDKIRLNEKNEIEISVALIERQKDRRILMDEYRNLWVLRYLTSNWLEKFKFYNQLRTIERRLSALDFEKDDLEDLQIQARRLAWLQALKKLKQAHLLRVFSISAKEFEQSSKQIEQLTKLTRSLAIDISQRGFKLIETNLHSLAIQTAKYKIELLQSLQNLDNNPSRANEITSIQNALKRLNKA